MSILRAVIFDLDGVLVTTDRFHYLGWKKLSDELDIVFDESVNHRLRGVSREESLKLIYRHNGRPLPQHEEFVRQCAVKNEYYKRYVGAMTPDDVLPGSLALLDGLRASEIRCAVASSSKNAGVVLERTALRSYFDAVSDGNGISKSKPDPEVFLKASALLGVPCGDCIGAEDADAGVTAIRRAGMVSVGIGEQGGKADYAAGSVGALSVTILREVFSRFRT